ncbi:MAG TPA: plastocyanin/azurin family copper-binding protein [Candidatus Limnocylindria bacterium]
MRRIALLLIPILAMVLAACSPGGGSDKTVRVRMHDDMRYDPDAFEFIAGDTVTFEVSNAGQVRHEFFVGGVAAHEEHAAEMREGGHSEDAHSNPAAVSVPAGASGTLTYTFEDSGNLLVACHEPGHYEAGMVAPITVHPKG